MDMQKFIKARKRIERQYVKVERSVRMAYHKGRPKRDGFSLDWHIHRCKLHHREKNAAIKVLSFMMVDAIHKLFLATSEREISRLVPHHDTLVGQLCGGR